MSWTVPAPVESQHLAGEGQGVHAQPLLRSECKANLDYRRPCLKNKQGFI